MIKIVNIGVIKNIAPLWKQLDENRKKQTTIVLVATLIGSILEAIGVGIVIPVVGVLLGVGEFNIYLNEKISSYLQIDSRSDIVIAALFVLFAVYFIKALFLLIMYRLQAKFIYGIKADFSILMLSKYMKAEYDQIIQINVATLISNLTTEIQLLTNRVTKPVVTLITEVFIVIAIGILFVIWDPRGTFWLFLSLVFLLFIYDRYSRPFLIRWGNQRQNAEAKKVQLIKEGLHGFREYRLSGTYEHVIKRYAAEAKVSLLAETNEEALYHVPRVSLELLGVWGILIFALIATTSETQSSNMIVTMSVFAAAAFRVLPSVNRIIGSIQSIAYCSPFVKTVVNELDRFKNEKRSCINPMPFKDSISFKGVSYRYPNANNDVIKRIDLRINRGDRIGIIGGSGEGKSTIADLIAGLIHPTEGQILIDEKEIMKFNRDIDLIGMRIAYVHQDTYCTNDSIKNNVAFGVDDSEIDDVRINQALTSACLEQFISSLPEGIETSICNIGEGLSGGQKQRIAIARALYRATDILIIDEGTSALDIKTEKMILEKLRDLPSHMTIIIITHRQELLEICNKIYTINAGILEGAKTS